MSKDAFYFSHDSNARNDLKIVRLRRKYGYEGYGLYWCLIEILRDTAEYKLPITDLEDIAFDLNVRHELLLSIVNDFKLFNIEDNYFCSNRLCYSMQQYNETKGRLSEAGKKGMAKRWGNNGNGNGKMVL